jgi:hypothetical protein
VPPRPVIGQRRVGIPFAILPLGQQVLGRDPLNAGAACGEHAMHHYRFMEVRGARQQFVERETVGRQLIPVDVPLIVFHGFPDAQPADGIERAGAQQRQIGRLGIGKLEMVEEKPAAVTLRDEII